MPSWPSSTASPAVTSWPANNAWPSASNWPAGSGGSELSGFTATTDAMFWDTWYFHDNGTPPPNDAVAHDQYARIVLTTSATSLVVEAVYGSAQPFNQVDVYVNGVYNQTINDTQGTALKVQHTITLPAGQKTVELTEGAYLTGVSASSYSILNPPSTVARYIQGFGDSIMAGYYATALPNGFWPGVFRHGISPRFDGVFCDGTPSDSIWHEGGNGANSFTNIIATLTRNGVYGTVENRIFIQYGTNDYGRIGPGLWSASDFQTGYGALLDQIHAAFPTYLIDCMTPFYRQVETANFYGNTLDDYRNAIIAAVSTRTSFARVIDGKGAWTQSQISTLSIDGLHPPQALHDQAGAYLLGIYGIIKPAGIASAEAFGQASVVNGITPGSGSGPNGAIGEFAIGG